LHLISAGIIVMFVVLLLGMSVSHVCCASIADIGPTDASSLFEPAPLLAESSSLQDALAAEQQMKAGSPPASRSLKVQLMRIFSKTVKAPVINETKSMSNSSGIATDVGEDTNKSVKDEMQSAVVESVFFLRDIAGVEDQDDSKMERNQTDARKLSRCDGSPIDLSETNELTAVNSTEEELTLQRCPTGFSSNLCTPDFGVYTIDILFCKCKTKDGCTFNSRRGIHEFHLLSASPRQSATLAQISHDMDQLQSTYRNVLKHMDEPVSSFTALLEDANDSPSSTNATVSNTAETGKKHWTETIDKDEEAIEELTKKTMKENIKTETSKKKASLKKSLQIEHKETEALKAAQAAKLARKEKRRQEHALEQAGEDAARKIATQMALKEQAVKEITRKKVSEKKEKKGDKELLKKSKATRELERKTARITSAAEKESKTAANRYNRRKHRIEGVEKMMGNWNTPPGHVSAFRPDQWSVENLADELRVHILEKVMKGCSDQQNVKIAKVPATAWKRLDPELFQQHGNSTKTIGIDFEACSFSAHAFLVCKITTVKESLLGRSSFKDNLAQGWSKILISEPTARSITAAVEEVSTKWQFKSVQKVFSANITAT